MEDPFGVNKVQRSTIHAMYDDLNLRATVKGALRLCVQHTHGTRPTYFGVK